MNSYLFVNPLSGRYDSGLVAIVVKRLQEIGLSPALREVTSPVEIQSRCQTMEISTGKPLIIIAAGDGTINAVINSLPPGKATIAILPLGTSNVLAAELGIRTIQEGIERIAAGKTRSLPLGVLRMKNASHRFVLMAGIGVDGAIVRDVRPLAKRWLKQGAYALSAIHCALNWDHGRLEVRFDGKSLMCHGAVICSASRYGGNFTIAPENDLFSSNFTVVCILSQQRRDYLKLALDLFTRRLDTNSRIVRIPAREVEILGNKPIQIDGDFVGYSPARFSTIDNFIEIIA